MTETTPEPAQLRIQFSKRNDGSVVLQLFRADNSTTWKRYDKQAVFFSFHDLTHFAVETTLSFEAGFYGLIATGWDIPDTEGKGPRGKPPAEAVIVEHVVGLLSGENAGGAAPLSTAEFNAHLHQMAAANDIRIDRNFTDGELFTVRKRIHELHSQWASLPAGSVLELIFNTGGTNGNAG
jgi:hypothetical protein